MRGWMNDRRSYVPPVGIGEVMRAGGVGRVVASRHADFKEGDHVSGMFGVQDYALSDGRARHDGAGGNGAADEIPQRARHAGDDRVLRAARYRPARRRRDRGGLRRRRCGGPGRRPDRQDQGLPRRGHRRRGGEVPLHRRRARLRCRRRLQERGCPHGAPRALPGPRGRLLRQRRRRHPRHRAHQARSPRAHRDLRLDLAVQQRRAGARSRELHGAARRSRPHGGVPGLRLRQALRRSRQGAGRLDRRGTPEIASSTWSAGWSASPRRCSRSTAGRTSAS